MKWEVMIVPQWIFLQHSFAFKMKPDQKWVYLKDFYGTHAYGEMILRS